MRALCCYTSPSWWNGTIWSFRTENLVFFSPPEYLDFPRGTSQTSFCFLLPGENNSPLIRGPEWKCGGHIVAHAGHPPTSRNSSHILSAATLKSCHRSCPRFRINNSDVNICEISIGCSILFLPFETKLLPTANLSEKTVGCHILSLSVCQQWPRKLFVTIKRVFLVFMDYIDF